MECFVTRVSVCGFLCLWNEGLERGRICSGNVFLIFLSLCDKGLGNRERTNLRSTRNSRCGVESVMRNDSQIYRSQRTVYFHKESVNRLWEFERNE